MQFSLAKPCAAGNCRQSVEGGLFCEAEGYALLCEQRVQPVLLQMHLQPHGPLRQVLHLRSGLHRQTVLHAWPRKNRLCNVAHQFELLLRRIGQQGNHQVFQCDHANLQLHQLRVGEWRHTVGPLTLRPKAGAVTDLVPTLIVPARQRFL